MTKVIAGDPPVGGIGSEAAPRKMGVVLLVAAAHSFSRQE